MHRMQSNGWPYSKGGREFSKAPSHRAAVLRAAVFRLNIICSNYWCVNVCVRSCTYKSAGGTGNINGKAKNELVRQGKQCMYKCAKPRMVTACVKLY